MIDIILSSLLYTILFVLLLLFGLILLIIGAWLYKKNKNYGKAYVLFLMFLVLWFWFFSVEYLKGM